MLISLYCNILISHQCCFLNQTGKCYKVNNLEMQDWSVYIISTLFFLNRAKVSWSGVQTTSQSDDYHHRNTTVLSKPVSSSATLYTVPHSSKPVPLPRVCSAPTPCTRRVFPSTASTTNDWVRVPHSGEQGSTLRYVFCRQRQQGGFFLRWKF